MGHRPWRDMTAAGDEPADGALCGLLARDLDAGFTELVRCYERTLYSIALRTCDQPADAEDLAADAFARAYAALRGYDRDRLLALRPRPWLVTIQLNVCRNWGRAQARRPDHPARGQHALPDGEQAAPGADVEPQAELAETSRELAGLLALLPPAQRYAVVLRHVAGMPVDEIAEVLGCPPGTVKSHVSRALSRLRTMLTPRGADGDERRS
jgi:RNA polymerase sigma factor (sigma-70 family)